MPAWNIPDDAERTYAEQAKVYEADLDALVMGIAGDGVVSGCDVTAQGSPNMTLAVASGVIQISAARVTVSAGNVTVTTADATNPRLDLVVVNNAGTKSVVAGTAAATPIAPELPADSVLLARVQVPAAVTAITAAMLSPRIVSTARIGARANSAGSTYARRRFNFIPGTNVTLTVDDDAANEEIDVTINAAGGGGGSGNKLGYVVASSDSPTAFKNMADYVCDGTNDEVQIQAAIDAADAVAAATDDAGAINVYLLGGRYYLGAGITGKAPRIIGAGYRSGVTIYWNGSAGATAWTQSGTAQGSLTYGGISGVHFSNGTAHPGIWLDLSADGVDNGWILDQVGFIGGAIQIKMTRWVNVHWHNLRFDNWSDFAIVCTAETGLDLATFVIDQFTFDHDLVSCNGFVKIDNSIGNSNLGTFTLRGGRMEANVAWGGNKGIVELVTSTGASQSRWIGLEFDDVVYQEIVATPATHSLVYSNTAATTISVSLTLKNVRQSGLDAILAGTLVAGHPVIPVQANYGFVSISADSGVRPDAVFNRVQVGGSGGTITSGAGAPSEAEPNGSLYLNTSGTASSAQYARVAGAWVPTYRTGSTTWDPVSLVNGAMASTTVTVTGAAVGQPAAAGLSTITAAGWEISASVTATNTVTVTLVNHTGGTVNLASGTLTVAVFAA